MSTQQPPEQPLTSERQPQPPTSAAPAPAKKTSPWVWVAVGCGGLLVIVLLVVLAGGYLVARKAKEFVAEAEGNPALAAVKAAVAFNPDIEIVDADTDDQVVTIRNVKTGETYTVDLREAAEGRIRFRNDEGEEVSIGGSGEEGEAVFKVESDEGTFAMGGESAGEAPGWVPRYPEAEVQGSMASTTAEGLEGGFSLTTQDTVGDVLDFYRRKLEGAGLSVTKNTFQQDDQVQGGLVSGTTEDRSRTCTVTVTRGDEGTLVAVSYKQAK